MFSSNKGTLQSSIGGSGFNNLSDIINAFLPYVFAIALIMVFVYLVLGGFGVMTSKGDPKAMEGAKSKITYAIIGFVIIFISFWLVQLLGLTTGLGNFGGSIGGINTNPIIAPGKPY